MENYSKEIFSGSTNGRGIKVVAVATAGTLIHTASASAKDEVWLYAFNSHTAAVLLTIEFGGVTDPNDLIELTIDSQVGLMIVIPGLILENSLIVRAFAGTTNVITIHGFVNRIS